MTKLVKRQVDGVTWRLFRERRHGLKGAKTFTITPFSIMTHVIMPLSITLNITTINIITPTDYSE
jgi:hypothetical protein